MLKICAHIYASSGKTAAFTVFLRTDSGMLMHAHGRGCDHLSGIFQFNGSVQEMTAESHFRLQSGVVRIVQVLRQRKMVSFVFSVLFLPGKTNSSYNGFGIQELSRRRFRKQHA